MAPQPAINKAGLITVEALSRGQGSSNPRLTPPPPSPRTNIHSARQVREVTTGTTYDMQNYPGLPALGSTFVKPLGNIIVYFFQQPNEKKYKFFKLSIKNKHRK